MELSYCITQTDNFCKFAYHKNWDNINKHYSFKLTIVVTFIACHIPGIEREIYQYGSNLLFANSIGCLNITASEH